MDFGDFLWSLLIIYFIFFFFMILFRIIGDLFSDHETSGWEKTLWILFLLLLPWLGILIYLIVRGKGMTERSIAAQQAAQEAQQQYIRETASGEDAEPSTQQAGRLGRTAPGSKITR